MKQQILIVDDSATIRKMVRASLGPIVQADFAEAASGLEAIEQLALGPVALIVLDLNMPDMHGIDVLRFVRGHARARAVPVLILTTRGDEASRDAAVAAGASQYLTKPFRPETLLAAARTLVTAAGDAASLSELR